MKTDPDCVAFSPVQTSDHVQPGTVSDGILKDIITLNSVYISIIRGAKRSSVLINLPDVVGEIEWTPQSPPQPPPPWDAVMPLV